MTEHSRQAPNPPPAIDAGQPVPDSARQPPSHAAKAAPPDKLVAVNDPASQVYLQMLRLKRQFRRGWLRAGIPPEQCESIADHAWGCALLGLLLAPRAGVDPQRAALLALVHELGEVHAGDITPHDGIHPDTKRQREQAAFGQLFAGVPDSDPELAASHQLIRQLWQEYEDQQSPEARFVKLIDRLEMGFQAAVHRAEGHGSLSDFHASVRQATAGSALESLWAELDT